MLLYSALQIKYVNRNLTYVYTTCRQVTVKRAVARWVHGRTLHETFRKLTLFTVLLHQHFGLNLPKWIISDHRWPILLWLTCYFLKISTSFTCFHHRAVSVVIKNKSEIVIFSVKLGHWGDTNQYHQPCRAAHTSYYILIAFSDVYE